MRKMICWRCRHRRLCYIVKNVISNIMTPYSGRKGISIAGPICETCAKDFHNLMGYWVKLYKVKGE